MYIQEAKRVYLLRFWGIGNSNPFTCKIHAYLGSMMYNTFPKFDGFQNMNRFIYQLH